jgi:hypothetical protein
MRVDGSIIHGRMSFITNKPTIGVINMRAYHFTSDKLRDGRPIPAVGEWLEHEGNIVACFKGLHASEHPFDALKYAPGCILHLVELEGDLESHGEPIDKWFGRRRKIIATINAEELLLEYARWCALEVIHLWDAPQVVREYLETGEKSLRKEACWAAAKAAVRSAAWSAVKAAVSPALRAAYWAAAVAAYRAAEEAAYWAAYCAAEADDNTAKYRKKFAEMVDEAFMQN